MELSSQSIVRMGDPRLYQQNKEVDFLDPELSIHIAAMDSAMKEHKGVGLAAPQIGIQKRIIIFGLDSNPRYPQADPIPLTVLINPLYEPLSDEMVDGWEACLSIPGLRGLVPRYLKIRYKGYSLQGEEISREVVGFHARVVQHEYDHLEGILYPQRMKDLKMFGFENAFDQWKI